MADLFGAMLLVGLDGAFMGAMVVCPWPWLSLGRFQVLKYGLGHFLLGASLY